MTAAIGVSVGLGSLGVALLSTLFTLIILAPDSPCDGYTAKHRAARIAEGDLPVSPRSPDRGRAHLEEAPGQARKASRSLPEIPQREPRVRRRRAGSRPGGPGSSLSNMKVTRQGRCRLEGHALEGCDSNCQGLGLHSVEREIVEMKVSGNESPRKTRRTLVTLFVFRRPRAGRGWSPCGVARRICFRTVE